MVTDDSGEVVSRRDFMPFGEELGVGVGGRTENLKYSYLGSDRVRQRFTGYEKDDETGLDFAEARMYQNLHGRFTAVDPLLASANAADPQTFNRYIYTSNNPVNHADPSGLAWCRKSGGATSFVGENVACSKEDGEDVTNSVVEIKAGDWSKEKAKVGDTVILNSNGSVTIVNSQEARAIAQGQSVVNVSVEVTGSSASDAAISGSNGSTVSGTITPRGMLSLPCPPEDSACGSGNVPFSSPLSQGASADEVLDASQTILESIGMVPGLEVADATSALISLFREDYTGAALSAGAILPAGGQIFTGIKWSRRAGRLGNAATRSHIDDIAGALKDRGYTVTNRGGPGFKEEYLRPIGGGRTGGSYVDITARSPNGKILRINTVDTLKNGKTPNSRERRNAARIRKQIGPGKHLLLIPKRK